MRRLFLIHGCAIIWLVTGAGCAYSKKDIVQPACNIPASVSYVTNIVPVLQNNCYSCHSTSNSSSGILLDNYNSLRYYAENGYLYGVITHASGYRPMPDDGGKISDCNIALIKKWIDTGMPQ